MIISFTGAQGTGKSTLINELKNKPFIDEAFFIRDDMTRDLSGRGLEINENGDNLTQLLIINSHVENITHKNSILSRSILDGLVYTTYLYEQGKVDNWVVGYAAKVFEMLIDQYDTMFYLPPEIPLVEDEHRSSNIKFRDDIVRLFEFFIDHYDLKSKVIELTGSVEERLEKVMEYIEKEEV